MGLSCLPQILDMDGRILRASCSARSQSQTSHCRFSCRKLANILQPAWLDTLAPGFCVATLRNTRLCRRSSAKFTCLSNTRGSTPGPRSTLPAADAPAKSCTSQILAEVL